MSTQNTGGCCGGLSSGMAGALAGGAAPGGAALGTAALGAGAPFARHATELVLVGGGGHALVVAEAAMLAGLAVVGFYDDELEPVLATAMGLERLGALRDLPACVAAAGGAVAGGAMAGSAAVTPCANRSSAGQCLGTHAGAGGECAGRACGGGHEHDHGHGHDHGHDEHGQDHHHHGHDEHVREHGHTPTTLTAGRAAVPGAGANGAATNGAAANMGPRVDQRHFIVALGDLGLRRRMLAAYGARPDAESVVHPAALISPSADVGAGVFVGPGAIVHTGALVAAHAIINSGAIVEHECEIGENAHVAPGAALGGRVRVGPDTLVGIGSRVLPGVRLGAGCTVGAGAVVTRDVPDGATVVGCPARVLTRPRNDAAPGAARAR